jgi:hypothetical protein
MSHVSLVSLWHSSPCPGRTRNGGLKRIGKWENWDGGRGQFFSIFGLGKRFVSIRRVKGKAECGKKGNTKIMIHFCFDNYSLHATVQKNDHFDVIYAIDLITCSSTSISLFVRVGYF